MKKLLPALLLLIVLLSSCTPVSLFQSPEELIRAPRLTGENAGLQQAFENYAGTGNELFSPRAGQYRSPYLIKDIDSDGLDEAIVFYCPTGTQGLIRMNLLVSSGGSWVSASDISGPGNEINNIEFADMDNDGCSEIIVSRSLPDSKKEYSFSVIAVTKSDGGEKSLKSLATFTGVSYRLCDATGDGYSEIEYLFFDNDNEQQDFKLRMLGFDKKELKLYPLSEILIDSFADNVNLFSVIKLNGEQKDRYTLVEYRLSDGSVSDEVVVFNDESFAYEFISAPGNVRLSDYSNRPEGYPADAESGTMLPLIPVILYNDENIRPVEGSEVNKGIYILCYLDITPGQESLCRPVLYDTYDNFSFSLESTFGILSVEYNAGAGAFIFRPIDGGSDYAFVIRIAAGSEPSIDVSETGHNMGYDETALLSMIT